MQNDFSPSSTGAKYSRLASLRSSVKRLTLDEVADAYTLLMHIEHLYPGFWLWFEGKVIPGCLQGSRAILTSIDQKSKEISGIAILKRDMLEKKICTLFVHPDHTGRGNGDELLAESLKWLEESHPIITVGEKRYGVFNRLFSRHGFELTSKINGLYKSGQTEYIFNDFACLNRASISICHSSLPYAHNGERLNVKATINPYSSSAETTLRGSLSSDAYS